jgi:hypothetical protein
MLGYLSSPSVHKKSSYSLLIHQLDLSMISVTSKDFAGFALFCVFGPGIHQNHKKTGKNLFPKVKWAPSVLYK